jgi:uncharacterized membrane protein HdeD (DUF308 family)
MLSLLTSNWWAVALRGVMAVLFGIVAWAWPGIALGSLIFMFGFFAMFDGVTAIFGAFLAPGQVGPRVLLGLAGATGVGAGMIAVARPDLTAEALLYVIAAWAIVSGTFEIAAGFSLGENAGSVLLWVLGGIASILFGGLLFIDPASGILAVVWLVGIYAITFGVMEIVLAFKLRGMGDEGRKLLGGRSHPAGHPA